MRGKGRDQHFFAWCTLVESNIVFPSPCGEKVGINGTIAQLRKAQKAEFPSPCGEKVGINLCTTLGASDTALSLVSVPLRGKGRDQRGDFDGDPVNLLLAFPSPCGEKLGINKGTCKSWEPQLDCPFPSPCGEKVGINDYMLVRAIGREAEFPSPCGEKVGINGEG